MRSVVLRILLAIQIAFPPAVGWADVATKVLPEGTRVYFRLDQEVSGKRGKAAPGDIVQCSVWRDVDVQGVVLIRAGTRGTCKVESVKHSNIVGIKGKMTIGALEARTVDGQRLQLTGGYGKEGKGRMAMTITLGVLLLPLIFIMGSPAILPEGTIFDAYSGPDIAITVPADVAVAHPVINLGIQLAPFSAAVILTDFENPDAELEDFRLRINKQGALPPDLVIDSVNGKPVEPLPLKIAESKVVDDSVEAIATIRIKTLAKHFQKGINRFEVSYKDGADRVAVETILNIQF